MNDGISDLEGGIAFNQAGPLTLPVEFETERYAAKWQFEGNKATRSQQPEIIAKAGKKAVGWAVWKHPVNKKPETRPLSGGNVILMCRPKVTQRAVNAIYGKISRDRMSNEIEGHTALGEPGVQGILTKEHLGADPSDIESGPMPSTGVFGDIAEIDGEMQIN